MLEYSVVRMVDVGDWDALVYETYGKPYSFQQQDGCKVRGTENIQAPREQPEEFYPDSIPYEINGDEMGVSFETWLKTEPSKYEDIFWERNFYPDTEQLLYDLYKKGLIDSDKYTIDIDW